MFNFEKTSYYHINESAENTENENKILDLHELPDGDYLGRHYCSCFELLDGQVYDTSPVGVRCTRKHSPVKWYTVSNGKLRQKYLNLYSLKPGIYTAKRYEHLIELEDGSKFDVFSWVKTKPEDAQWKHYEIRPGSCPEMIIEIEEADNDTDIHERNISELPNGDYYGLYYASCFELMDGTIYNTPAGILRSRELSMPNWYTINNGKITEKYPSIYTLETGEYIGRIYEHYFETEDGDIYNILCIGSSKKTKENAEWKCYYFDNGLLVENTKIFPFDFIIDGDYSAKTYYSKTPGTGYLELVNGTIYKIENIGSLSIKNDIALNRNNQPDFALYRVENGDVIKLPDYTAKPLYELPNGEYEGLYYANHFELKDGRLFNLNHGIRRSRKMTGYHTYDVIDGNLREIDDIDELPDGEYDALRYLNILELKDGHKYATKNYVKNTRRLCSWKKVKIKNGQIISI